MRGLFKTTISLMVLVFMLVVLSSCTQDIAQTSSSSTDSDEASSAISEGNISAEESSPVHPLDGIWLLSSATRMNPLECQEIYSYYENGLPKEIIATFPDSKKEQRTVYTYDDDQNMLSCITTDQNGNVIAYIEQSFADGKLIQKKELELGATREISTTYSYDASGRLLQKEPTDGNGYIETYSYHEDGGYTVTSTNVSGESAKYVYDAMGNPLEVYGDDGELDSLFIYDENDCLLEEQAFYAEEKIYAYCYEYDTNGVLLKKSYYSYDELVYTMIYEYDAYGNNTKIKHVSADGTERVIADMEYQLFHVQE